MDSFNLYREAKNQYEKLIPVKNDGLILLSLYSKYRDKDFTEENIISIINKVFKDQGNDSSRTEYNRNNTIILRLQESFLWRNETKRTYLFKKYGAELCQNIEKRLIEKYNPAKIKRFFDELHKSLTENIETGKDFNEWMEDHFEIRMPELASQIEILDQQVNESVIDFKTSIKSENQSILDILKEIEIRLEVIKEQAAELKNAFQIYSDVDELLTGILEQKEGTRKRILFPNNLPALKVKSLTVLPKFNVIPIRVISPKLPVKVTQRQIDLTKRKELVNKTSKWKHDKERIIYWTNVAFQELDEKSPLIFTPLFFKIIETDRLEIAVKTAHNIIRRCKKQKYYVEVEQNSVSYPLNKGISLWQMKIQKK